MSFPTFNQVIDKINNVIRDAVGTGVVSPVDHADVLTGETDDVGILERYEAEKTVLTPFPGLQSGWSIASGTFPVATLKADGDVQIRAALKNDGTGGSTISNALTESLRPPETVGFVVPYALGSGTSPTASSGDITRVGITSAGVLSVRDAVAGMYFLSLNYTIRTGNIEL